MQEEQSPSAEYLAGFNQGYLIQKHLPDLGEKLSKSLSNTERSEAFKDGQKQFMLEKEQSKPKFLQKDRLANSKREPNKSKDKGKDYERE
jgi:hypothetical protein